MPSVVPQARGDKPIEHAVSHHQHSVMFGSHGAQPLGYEARPVSRHRDRLNRAAAVQPPRNTSNGHPGRWRQTNRNPDAIWQTGLTQVGFDLNVIRQPRRRLDGPREIARDDPTARGSTLSHLLRWWHVSGNAGFVVATNPRCEFVARDCSYIAHERLAMAGKNYFHLRTDAFHSA
jgi:hypothetical protein